MYMVNIKIRTQVCPYILCFVFLSIMMTPVRKISGINCVLNSVELGRLRFQGWDL